MNTPLVLIDNEKSTLARIQGGIATDVVWFVAGTLFFEQEIEQLRVSPLAFKEGIAQ